ncbi:MAG: dephospho-CoA kinase [Chlamydiae bacterium]|nr:dephospho-CoA kinase [Chlamydiota bacterium]MBI3266041.1 dephospho-CoA kinase [Chlamydiota bacterium]
MLMIGLTGGIGAGKSTVGQYFRALGAKVIDTDKLAKECLKEKDTEEEVVKALGPLILNRAGHIHRKRLAEVVFSNKKKLVNLENILHPRIFQKVKTLSAKIQNQNKLCVVIVPLLFEKHWAHHFEKTIVVLAPKNLRIQRAARHLKVEFDGIRKRMHFQLKAKFQKEKADFAIDNKGSKQDLKKEVEKIFKHIKGESTHG